MEQRRYKNIFAVQTEANRFIGFHARNLAVAEITPEAWRDLDGTQPAFDVDARREIETWNNEIDPATSDEVTVDNIQTLSLNVAQICNLKCTYCAAGGDGTYGSPVTKIDTSKAEAQIQFFLGRAKINQTFRIEFLGGEPLLYPQIIDSLCRFAKLSTAGSHIELEFVITTNGTLITSTVADILGRYHFGVTISLDGPPALNDQFRPSKSKTTSSTEMTLLGLRELAKFRAQLIYLNVNTVFGVHNTAVIETYDFLQSLDMNWDVINFNFANNQADEERATQNYVNEMRELGARLFKTHGLEGVSSIAQFRRPLARLTSQTRTHSYCSAGKSLLLADTKADLYTCNWFMNDPSEKIGHLTSIDETKLAKYQPSLIELNNCESCWARHLCGGGCMAVHKGHSGHRHGKNPNFCYRTRELSATAIQYFADSFSEN